jgi:hypothetical protein
MDHAKETSLLQEGGDQQRRADGETVIHATAPTVDSAIGVVASKAAEAVGGLDRNVTADEREATTQAACLVGAPR